MFIHVITVFLRNEKIELKTKEHSNFFQPFYDSILHYVQWFNKFLKFEKDLIGACD